MIVEVQPVVPDSGIIVWEWHIWDHLIQDTDSRLPNNVDIDILTELIMNS